MSLVTLFAWLLDSAAGRILASLGMGFLTFGTVVAVGNTLASQFSNLWGGLPTAVLQILSLAGFPIAVGTIIGAYIASLTLNSLSKIGKISP